MTNSIRAIDCVVNPITPEIMAMRPAWSKSFWQEKIGRDSSVAQGLTHHQMLELMDRAGIERAVLIATKTGQLGIPGSWHLPYKVVAEAVQQHPDRFSGLAGLDPTEGMAGVRALRHAVQEYGFVGAHFYPHWFELAPDHARWYPFYAACVDLDVPVGIPWTEEMIAMSWKHPNVYIGCDAHSPRYWPASFVHYINSYGQDKVIFGTDYPVLDFQRTRDEIEALGLKGGVLAKLLRENARRLYRLP